MASTERAHRFEFFSFSGAGTPAPLKWVHLLSGLLFATATFAQAPPAIDWELDYEVALDRAKTENKPLLIDFYADWCGPCKMMEAQTFADPRVVEAVEKFIPVQVDVDANQKVAFAYKIRSIPRTVVLNVHREIVGDRIGFLGADEYLAFLEDVAQYTHRKLDGIVVTLPETVAGDTTPTIAVNADTAQDTLHELLANPNPDLRRAARGELIRRGDDAVSAFLNVARNAEYLGMRIAADEVLEATQPHLAEGFDPWSPLGDRDSR